jgi:hypothetical protein
MVMQFHLDILENAMSNKRTIPWGDWFIPILALLYAAYTVIDQIIRGLADSTIMYSVFLAAVIVVFAVISIIQGWRHRPEVDISPECRAGRHKISLRLILFVLWGLFFIPALIYLGYAIAVFVYLGVLLWALGERPWYKVLAIDLAFVMIVHFLFVKTVGMPLEPGLLKGIF